MKTLRNELVKVYHELYDLELNYFKYSTNHKVMRFSKNEWSLATEEESKKFNDFLTGAKNRLHLNFVNNSTFLEMLYDVGVVGGL